MTASTSSGLQSASAAITSRTAFVHAVTLVPGSAASTLTVYDSSAASGTELAILTGAANGASVTVTFNSPIEADTAVYASVAGTSAQYIVHYSLR